MPIWIDVGDGTVIVPPPAVPPPPPPPSSPPPPPPPSAPPPSTTPTVGEIPQPGQTYLPGEDVGLPPGTIVPTPPAVPPPPSSPPPPGGSSGDAYPPEDAGDWPDPEEGDAGETDAGIATLEAEADAIDAGERVPLASSHPPPGTVIGEPYVGTHAKAFNVAGGSDNWESENAVDVWLYPGTHVVACLDGVISPGGWGFGQSASGGRFAGYRVHLVASNGRVFYYTHLAGLQVVKGQHVKRGDYIGPSGVANGVPHLHFAVNPPFDPHAFVRDAYDLKHRTSIGTNPKTGGPPDETSPTVPAGVVNNWRELVRVFSRQIPAGRASIKSNADALVRIFQ